MKNFTIPFFCVIFLLVTTRLNAQISPSDTTICDGSSITLTAPSGNNYAYLWTPGGETTQSITVSPNDTTEYSVFIDDNTVRIDTFYASVNVPPLLQVSQTVATSSADGLTYILSFQIYGGDNTYTVTGVGGILEPAQGLVQTFTSDPIPDGTPYNISVTDGLNCNPQTLTGTHNCACVCGGYPLVNAGNSTSHDVNNAYTFADAVAIDAVDFLSLENPSKAGVLWLHDGNGTLDDNSITNPTYTPDPSDLCQEVTFTLIGFSGEPNQVMCPNDSATVVLQFTNQVENIAVEAGNDTIRCVDVPYEVSGASLSKDSAFLWTHDGSGTFINENTLTPTYTPNISDVGSTITLSLTSISNLGCEFTDQLTIDVASLPTSLFEEDVIICQNEISFSADDFLSPTYTDSVSITNLGSGQLSISTDTTNFTYTALPEETGLTIACFVNAHYSWCEDRIGDTIYIDVIDSLVPEAGQDTVLCDLTSYTVVDASIVAGTELLAWTHDGDGTFSDMETLTPTYVPTQTECSSTVNLTLITRDIVTNCEREDHVSIIYTCDELFSCSVANIIGTAYLDENNNCIKDQGEKPVTNQSIELWSGGQLLKTSLTNEAGGYRFYETPGTYEIKFVNPEQHFTTNCTSSYTVSGDDTFERNFGLECNGSGYDVEGVITSGEVIRPGVSTAYSLNVWNNSVCDDPISIGVKIVPDNLTTFSSSSDFVFSNDTIIGSINWDETLVFNSETVVTANIGDTVCFTVILDSIPGEIEVENNVQTFCFPVVNSYDPNDKQVHPFNGNVRRNTDFTYQIRFQNTGNAEALDIYILDTLSEHLDLNSLQVIDNSHPMETELNGNVLRFLFNDINLPDSVHNEPESHGYVIYRISAKPEADHGDRIENTAGIYFDYNPPVITNTVVNTIDTTTNFTLQILINEWNNQLDIFPNPTKGIFNLVTDLDGAYEVQIINQIGETIYRKAIMSQSVGFDLSAFPAGVYYVKIISEGVSIGKKILLLR